jgi:mono/diheme cytochrome c family protein
MAIPGTLFRAVTAAVLWLAPMVARAQPSPLSPAVLERGRYLVETAAFCGVCHDTRGSDGRILLGMGLAGGRVLAERDFRAVVPNISPDPETGIGRWTDSQVALAIREGRRPDGSIIGPPMPIELYRGLSDNDLTSIVVYLRSVPPVHHAVTERSTYSFPLTSYGPPVTDVPDPPNNPVARGAYLAGPVAHCLDCHTPPLPNDHRDWSRVGAGGVALEGPWGLVVAPNITPNKEFGIGSWTDEQVIRAVTQGISADGKRLAPPMSGRAPIWARLTEQDQHDLVAYLRSLTPQGP